MKKLPREAIEYICFANRCDENTHLCGNYDILEEERKWVEKCISDFVKHYIKIEQYEVTPGIYETKGTIIVIDQDKIKDNEQEEETDNA